LKFVNLTSDNFLVCHFLEELRQIEDEMIVVAPDKGAVGRAKGVWNYFGSSINREKHIANNRTLFGEKVRDPDTGEILGTLVFAQDDDGNANHLIPGRPNSSHIKGKPILIVDDICDGGRTFIELAKVLREYGPSQITLYVTHGIFSKGFNVFKDESGKPLIDNLLIANPFQKCLDWAEYEEVKISKTLDNKIKAISVRLQPPRNQPQTSTQHQTAK
jgi:ribose-phosphate pyrophosphokinase